MTKTNLPTTLGSSNSLAAGNDIRGIKGPIPIPNPWIWVGSAVGLLILVALVWWLWRKRRRRETAPVPVPVIPPHEKARARLKEALGLLNQPLPFCVLVSDTIRVYLEERFHLRAPERTTEEFLEELQSSALLTFEQKRALGEFLMSYDLVKFARYEPGEAELRAIYDAAVRLVDETEPPPPVTSPPTSAEAATRTP